METNVEARAELTTCHPRIEERNVYGIKINLSFFVFRFEFAELGKSVRLDIVIMLIPFVLLLRTVGLKIAAISLLFSLV